MNGSISPHIGAWLREAREAKGLTVQAAASRLNLRLRSVQALESGDFAALPGDAYIRGYLRNYAQLLDMDTAALLAAYEEERRGQPRNERYFIPEPTVDGYTPGPRVLWLSATLTALLYMGWAYWHDPAPPAPMFIPPPHIPMNQE